MSFHIGKVNKMEILASSSRMCFYVPRPQRAGLHPPDFEGSTNGAYFCEAQHKTLT